MSVTRGSVSVKHGGGGYSATILLFPVPVEYLVDLEELKCKLFKNMYCRAKLLHDSCMHSYYW